MRVLIAAAAAAACLVCTTAQSYPINPWPLEGVVATARANAAATPLVRGTGLKKADYLPVINGIVSHFIQYQNANGSIIDPYANEEIQYATPTFACASSLVIKTGYNTSAAMMNASVKALTAALTELSNGYAPQGHYNFFTFPIMMAFWNLRDVVSTGQVAAWETMLRNIDVQLYKTGGNWGLVAVGGEYLRTSIGGYGNASWWQQELSMQFSTNLFTPNGQYEDHSGMDGLNPLPYDEFPCKYLTVMLAQGFNNTGLYGNLSSTIEELMTRSAWTHLLMQSPWGEIPTGGRSSQHSWNEAAAAAIYEVQAGRYLASGDAQAACMFKRAAHMSLASLKRWQNPTGELQIVKNHFPPVDRWGYEVYSFFSQYNLLPASQLATAYMFATEDSEVEECSTFADVGGFAIQLPEYNLVIANAGGVYAEIETGSDPHYDSTGLTRVHVNNCATVAEGCVSTWTLVGPTAGPPQENGGFGYGAWWATLQGGNVTQRLGNLNFTQVTAATFTGTPGRTPSNVAFTVQYVLLDQNILVSESYALSSSGRIDVTAGVSLIGRADDAITRFGITCPVFLFDGVTNTTASVPSGPSGGKITVSVSAAAASASQWGTQSCVVYGPPGGHSFTVSYDPNAPTVTRNGLSVPVDIAVSPVETNSPSLSYSIIASGNAVV